jgi:hypothetical protein
MRSTLFVIGVFIVLLGRPSSAHAHVGSPEIVYDGDAGPYRVFVAIEPPIAIPGLAHAKIRCASEGLRTLDLVAQPIGMDRYAPRPDRAQRDPRDPRYFTADLWIMTPGTWRARIIAQGERGRGELALPVPSLPAAPHGMHWGLGLLLAVAGCILTAGAVSIVGAALREGQLAPTAPISPAAAKRARRGMLSASALLAVLILATATWWSDTAQRFAELVYRPIQVTAWTDDSARLSLQLQDPGWLPARRLDGLVPDHGHLMHLFMLRMPAMDQVLHLHPDLQGQGLFTRDLPAIPGGHYRLFGDIVDQSGLAETLVTDIELPDISGHSLTGDDANASVPPMARVTSTRARWDDGANMVWLAPITPLKAKAPLELRFRVEDKAGQAATDLEPYMGMSGHMAVVRQDLSVFAHIHPSGTVPMAALAVAAGASSTPQAMPNMADMLGMADMPGMHHRSTSDAVGLSPEISFPYAFPRAGWYRLVVQVKEAGNVRTATFDVEVLEQ